MKLNDRLKIARESLGYTQAKASQEAGIGVSSISEFENGTREPKFSQLSKLAAVYRRTVEFFLSESLAAEGMMLWRDKPTDDEALRGVEAQFRQLCEQYHRLEILTGEARRVTLPQSDVQKADALTYPAVEALAQSVNRVLGLGDIPAASLKKAVEDTWCVKVFYLDFTGSAISTVSEEFGPAILLNSGSKLWRRNFDLAHELFHILTWRLFRGAETGGVAPSEQEEKYANAFASALLMPEEHLKNRMEKRRNADDSITMEQLCDISREFEVSVDALICRIANVFRLQKEATASIRVAANKVDMFRCPRLSDTPERFPERYCYLAERALREGKLSLMQFARYMAISYKEAEKYVEDEEATDGTMSLSLA
jgi:Zn-dependent peptidase ImmA (M78 family)/transcriptional regulator with XRE-family HTH domain